MQLACASRIAHAANSHAAAQRPHASSPCPLLIPPPLPQPTTEPQALGVGMQRCASPSSAQRHPAGSAAQGAHAEARLLLATHVPGGAARAV